MLLVICILLTDGIEMEKMCMLPRNKDEEKGLI